MRSDINGAFDDMVEALEENEDMVECKECFDLFPKEECEKSDIGYVCPVCRKRQTIFSTQCGPECAIDPFATDFPEVADYAPEDVRDFSQEARVEDAFADLIRDEYEAIDGYEVADETIQHASISAEAKDEILDTLDHIKEEEEEHIDELKELCPECDPATEPKKLEEAADDEATDEEPETEEIPEEGAEDSEENEEVKDADLEAAYDEAFKVANEKGVGQVFGYATIDDETFVAIEPFDVDDVEAVEDDLRAVYDDVKYAFVAYPQSELEEKLLESNQLTEGPLNRLKNKIGAAASAVKNTLSGEASARKGLDKLFTNEYFVLATGPDVPNEKLIKTSPTADMASKTAKGLSVQYPKATVTIIPKAIDPKVLKSLPPAIQTLIDQRPGGKTAASIATYKGGKVFTSKIKELEKKIEDINFFSDMVDKNSSSVGKDGKPTDSARDAIEAEEDEQDTDTTGDETDTTGDETDNTGDTGKKRRDKKGNKTGTTDDENTDDDLEDDTTDDTEETEDDTIDPNRITAETFEVADKIFNSTYDIVIVSKKDNKEVAKKRSGILTLKTALLEAEKSSKRDSAATVYVIGAAVKPEEYEDIDGEALQNKLRDVKLWQRKKPPLFKTSSQTLNLCFTPDGPVLLATYKNGERLLDKKTSNLLGLQKNVKAINEIIALGKSDIDDEDDDQTTDDQTTETDETSETSETDETAGDDETSEDNEAADTEARKTKAVEWANRLKTINNRIKGTIFKKNNTLFAKKDIFEKTEFTVVNHPVINTKLEIAVTPEPAKVSRFDSALSRAKYFNDELNKNSEVTKAAKALKLKASFPTYICISTQAANAIADGFADRLVELSDVEPLIDLTDLKIVCIVENGKLSYYDDVHNIEKALEPLNKEEPVESSEEASDEEQNPENPETTEEEAAETAEVANEDTIKNFITETQKVSSWVGKDGMKYDFDEEHAEYLDDLIRKYRILKHPYIFAPTDREPSIEYKNRSGGDATGIKEAIGLATTAFTSLNEAENIIDRVKQFFDKKNNPMLPVYICVKEADCASPEIFAELSKHLPIIDQDLDNSVVTELASSNNLSGALVVGVVWGKTAKQGTYRYYYVGDKRSIHGIFDNYVATFSPLLAEAPKTKSKALKIDRVGKGSPLTDEEKDRLRDAQGQLTKIYNKMGIIGNVKGLVETPGVLQMIQKALSDSKIRKILLGEAFEQGCGLVLSESLEYMQESYEARELREALAEAGVPNQVLNNIPDIQSVVESVGTYCLILAEAFEEEEQEKFELSEDGASTAMASLHKVENTINNMTSTAAELNKASQGLANL